MGGVTRVVPLGVDLTTSGTTTGTYAEALGWECVGLGKKHIWLKNTHVSNGLKYKVLLYLSDVGLLEKEFCAETTLAAGATDEFILERAYSKVVVQVKTASGSDHATYQIDFTGGQA